MFILSRDGVFLLFILFFIIFSAIPIKGETNNNLNIVINEICWTGTIDSYNKEWIELYSNNETAVNLSGWSLKAFDGTPEIYLEEEILPKSFYLLERSNDETIPDTTADQIYVGSLENAGENLKLYDNSGKLVDFVNCENGWFAGDNNTKQTMERKDSYLSGNDKNNWQNSQNPNGTPKKENDRASSFQEEKINKEAEEEIENFYPGKIIFNEILPSPEGPDEENEWIEISNQNDFEVDLTNWKIVDKVGTINIYVFPEKTKIQARGFLVFYRPETKIILNNDNDGLIFLTPDGKLADEINYENAPQPPPAKSYNKIDEEWIWSEKLTPNNINFQGVISKEIFSYSEEEKNIINSSIFTGGIKRASPQKKCSFFIFLTSLSFSIFSGIMILFLKRCCNKRRIC